MYEHGYAVFESTVTVALTLEKTGAYENIFVVDVTAASLQFRSALWTVTRERTCYTSVIH